MHWTQQLQVRSKERPPSPRLTSFGHNSLTFKNTGETNCLPSSSPSLSMEFVRKGKKWMMKNLQVQNKLQSAWKRFLLNSLVFRWLCVGALALWTSGSHQDSSPPTRRPDWPWCGHVWDPTHSKKGEKKMRKAWIDYTFLPSSTPPIDYGCFFAHAPVFVLFHQHHGLYAHSSIDCNWITPAHFELVVSFSFIFELHVVVSRKKISID